MENIVNFLNNDIVINILGILSAIMTVIIGINVLIYEAKKIKELFKENEYRKYLIDELYDYKTFRTDTETGTNKNKKLTKKVDNIFLNQSKKEKIEKIDKLSYQMPNKEVVLKSYMTKAENKKDIIYLMLKNNDEITEYFKISKKHARSSFTFSVIASMIGVLMLGLAIYGVIIIENTQLSIIGLISGSITEAISGTVLWIHNKSALQLNHYYDALHQNEKFLSAVNMADKLSDEKREEMYMEIIRKQIDIDN